VREHLGVRGAVAVDAMSTSPVRVKRGRAREHLAARLAVAGPRALAECCAASKATQCPHSRGPNVGFRSPHPSRARTGGAKGAKIAARSRNCGMSALRTHEDVRDGRWDQGEL
jgi:hypothetical protein